MIKEVISRRTHRSLRQRLIVGSFVALALIPPQAGEDAPWLEISAEGVVRESPVGAVPADLPLLTGAVEAEEPLRVVLNLLEEIRGEDPWLWECLSEIHLLEDGGFEVYHVGSYTVAWGNGDIPEARRRAWALALRDLQRKGIRDAVLDLRFQGQVLVRLP